MDSTFLRLSPSQWWLSQQVRADRKTGKDLSLLGKVAGLLPTPPHQPPLASKKRQKMLPGNLENPDLILGLFVFLWCQDGVVPETLATLSPRLPLVLARAPHSVPSRPEWDREGIWISWPFSLTLAHPGWQVSVERIIEGIDLFSLESL